MRRCIVAEDAGLNGDTTEAEAWAYLAVRSLKRPAADLSDHDRLPRAGQGGMLARPSGGAVKVPSGRCVLLGQRPKKTGTAFGAATGSLQPLPSSRELSLRQLLCGWLCGSLVRPGFGSRLLAAGFAAALAAGFAAALAAGFAAALAAGLPLSRRASPAFAGQLWQPALAAAFAFGAAFAGVAFFTSDISSMVAVGDVLVVNSIAFIAEASAL